MEELDDDDAGTLSSCSATELSITSSSNSSARISRNMAEKQRRDNMNTQINIMTTLVPIVPNDSSKKVDKISVLRLCASYVRFLYVFGGYKKPLIPSEYPIHLEDYLIQTTVGDSGFGITITDSGTIAYVSRHVEKQLGYNQLDLFGESVYKIVYEGDHGHLREALSFDKYYPSTSNETNNASNTKSNDGNYTSTDNDQVSEFQSSRNKTFLEQRRVFYVRMAQRSNSRRESTQYEYVQLSGVLKLANEIKEMEANGEQWKPEKRSRNDVVFTGYARLLKMRTVMDLSLLDFNKDEYFTRHLVDGRIIYCDNRISLIAGYMREEVSGTSAFKFMHRDDVKWTIVALRHMYDHGKNYGSSCYRLITKTGEYIYLRTHGYLEWDERTKSVGSFICINTLTTQEEGERLIADMKNRFSATISGSTAKAIQGIDDDFESESDCINKTNREELNLDNTSQLEQDITHLISDLPSPVMSENCETSDSQVLKAAAYSKHLPPASIQASYLGIDSTKPFPGKNGKGKLNNQESSTQNTVERPRVIAEKKIPELEDSLSPLPANRKHSISVVKKGFSSQNSNEQPISPQSLKTDEQLLVSQASAKNNNTLSTENPNILAQKNLKRPRGDIKKMEHIPMKRKTTNRSVNLNLSPTNNSESFINEELEYITYIPVQDDNAVTVSTMEDQLIGFQNEPFIKSLNLPSSVNEEENIHQYSAGDVSDFIN